MNSIVENLSHVQLRIRTACKQHQRDFSSVRLIAVSKTKPATDVATAFNAGQVDFGENYLQEAALKVETLPAAQWHFIGAIQSNKTREIAERFSYVHGVSTLKVAKRLSDQRPRSLPPLGVFFQVNIDDEATKSGTSWPHKGLYQSATAVFTGSDGYPKSFQRFSDTAPAISQACPSASVNRNTAGFD